MSNGSMSDQAGMRNKDNHIPLKLSDKMTYFSGAMGFCMFFMTIGGYLLYVYTDVFYLNPVTAANIFLFTRFWDAINDPMMGYVVDLRLFAKKGKGVYRPWILISIPLLVITFICSFTMPSFIKSEAGKTAWAIVFYVLYTMAQTVGQVPFGSLSNAITTDTEERGLLGNYRNFGENVGNLLVSMTIMGMVGFFGHGGKDVARGYTGAVTVIALMAAVFLFICYKNTKENAIEATEENAEEHHTLKDNFHMLSQNRPVICLALGLFVAAVVLNFKFAFNMYYIQNYLKGGAGMITTINSTQTAVSIIGFWIVSFMVRHMEKRNMMVLCGILFVADGGIFLAARTNYPLVLAGSVLFGFLMTLSFATIWGAIPDGVEYGLWKTGICAPAFLFAMVTFAQKCGIGIASFLAGKSLHMIGYVAGHTVSEATANGIYLWNGGVLLVGGIAFILCTIGYNLSKEKYCEIIKELDERNAAK